MNVTATTIPDVKLIEPRVFGDQRGFFLETYQAERYREQAGIHLPFVQDNYSRSERGVLRGLHLQKTRPQGKLVRVAKGEVFDVAVDLRPESETFKQWVGAVLSDSNYKQLWVPPGFAHGFLVLSASADFEYKCTEYYHPEDEICLAWNDPDIGVNWPTDKPVLSAKDQAGIAFRELSL